MVCVFVCQFLCWSLCGCVNGCMGLCVDVLVRLCGSVGMGDSCCMGLCVVCKCLYGYVSGCVNELIWVC